MQSLTFLPEAEVKETIKEYYGSRIDSGSCCSPTQNGGSACCDEGALYSPDELAHLPEAAAGNSFGCGNPTAIAALNPGEVVLDLGSGGGIDVFLAARKVGPAGYVYGVDMTEKMVALARRNLAQMGVANVEFRQGEIEAIPLPDASVDVIISNCVINLSPDKPQVLREAFRVLKPGGRVAFSDIVVDGDLAALPVSESQIRAGLSWAGCIAGALTTDEFRTYLAAAGFTDIRVDVRHRYSTDEFRPYADGPDTVPGALAALEPAVMDSLAHCFTSSEVSARKGSE